MDHTRGGELHDERVESCCLLSFAKDIQAFDDRQQEMPRAVVVHLSRTGQVNPLPVQDLQGLSPLSPMGQRLEEGPPFQPVQTVGGLVTRPLLHQFAGGVPVTPQKVDEPQPAVGKSLVAHGAGDLKVPAGESLDAVEVGGESDFPGSLGEQVLEQGEMVPEPLGQRAGLRPEFGGGPQPSQLDERHFDEPEDGRRVPQLAQRAQDGCTLQPRLGRLPVAVKGEAVLGLAGQGLSEKSLVTQPPGERQRLFDHLGAKLVRG